VPNTGLVLPKKRSETNGSRLISVNGWTRTNRTRSPLLTSQSDLENRTISGRWETDQVVLRTLRSEFGGMGGPPGGGMGGMPGMGGMGGMPGMGGMGGMDREFSLGILTWLSLISTADIPLRHEHSC
jgi:hypothetical protein